ncbi:hypothetical protein SEUCBS139899_008063 [Sporothrix eucalyptigena]|uniref:2EXR domain-containing protein n=1 Tax=Sporothrix eucalyptigena TaxID=1812306 RepID=A0ABP0CCT6_9PEZI
MANPTRDHADRISKEMYNIYRVAGWLEAFYQNVHNYKHALAKYTDAQFHLFPMLPPELRFKIWQTAANAPECKHFYKAHNIPLDGQEPASFFRPDHGLWTACKESRQEVTRVYKATRAHVEEKGCAEDWGRPFEQHYRWLKDFTIYCKDIWRKLKAQRRRIHRLAKCVQEMEDAYLNLEHPTKGIRQAGTTSLKIKALSKLVPFKQIDRTCGRLQHGFIDPNKKMTKEFEKQLSKTHFGISM